MCRPQGVSKDLFRVFEVLTARRSYPGQREGKRAAFILVAHRAESQAAIFDAQTTAVPVVGDPNTAILQRILDKVITGVDVGAEPAFRRFSITEK